MANDEELERWAKRRNGGGGQARAVAPAPPAPAAQATLPAPPPGYGYAHHPQFGFVLVPMGPQPAVAPQVQRQPAGTVPYTTPSFQPPPGAPPTPAGYPTAPPGYGRVIAFPAVKTCELVKPGNVDNYANMLANVPDLAPGGPGSGYDAMAGRLSPESEAELAPFRSEFGGMPHDPPRAFPTQGRGTPTTAAHGPELKGAPPAPAGGEPPPQAS